MGTADSHNQTPGDLLLCQWSCLEEASRTHLCLRTPIPAVFCIRDSGWPRQRGWGHKASGSWSLQPGKHVAAWPDLSMPP